MTPPTLSHARRVQWQSYREVAMQTAPPGQLVLMLFDGALRFLEQARLGFAKHDPIERNETIHNGLQQAQAIINELSCALNLEAGGELAWTLHRLYDYFDRRLTESNVRKEPAGMLEVAARLKILREAWAEMLAQCGAQAPASTPSNTLSCFS